MATVVPLFSDGELAAAPERGVTAALAVWNEVAGRVGWPQAKHLPSTRRAALRRAIKDYGGVGGFKSYVEKAGESSFLTGKTGRRGEHVNWRPDIDWFCKPSTVIKILEDKYVDAGAAAGPAAVAPAKVEEPDRHKLRNYRPGGFWPAAWGPRPEDPVCHLQPPAMLAEWRRINKVSTAAPVRETREQRLTGLIGSYRRIGRYADANRIEEELAKLEGRPPTLVPDPAVADLGMPAKGESPHRGAKTHTDVEYEMVPEGEDFGNE